MLESAEKGHSESGEKGHFQSIDLGHWLYDGAYHGFVIPRSTWQPGTASLHPQKRSAGENKALGNTGAHKCSREAPSFQAAFAA